MLFPFRLDLLQPELHRLDPLEPLGKGHGLKTRRQSQEALVGRTVDLVQHGRQAVQSSTKGPDQGPAMARLQKSCISVAIVVFIPLVRNFRKEKPSKAAFRFGKQVGEFVEGAPFKRNRGGITRIV
jgi:hypothetical protein